MILSNKQLSGAEEAIIKLAEALNISENKMIEILESGLDMNVPNCKLNEREKELLEELKSFFN